MVEVIKKENPTQTTENSTSERFSELWGKMHRNQRRFVVAMQDSANKKDAAEAIGLEPDTVYRWPKYVDEAVELLSLNVKETATEILANNLAKAALIKVSGLDDSDPRVRQAVATEIIDRFMGKPSQPVTGEDGGAIIFKVVRE